MINRILTVSIIVVSIFASAGVAQVLSDEVKALTTTPNTQQKQEIDDYVKSYADSFYASEADALEVMTLRATMIKQIDKGKAGFNAAIADSIAAHFADTVFAENAKPVVKVSAAMVAASLKSEKAAGLFASMATNSNPAIRYYGWKGFEGVRDDIITAGGSNLDTMLTAVKDMAAKESNTLVIAQMAKACNFEIDADVARPSAEAARKAVLAAFETVVAANLQAVRDGDVSACDAIANFDESVASVFKEAPADQKRMVLQMIANSIANAAAAYKDGSKLDSDKILVPHSSIAIAITEGERAVNVISGTNSLAITRQVAQLIKSPTASGFGDMQARVDELIGGNGTAGSLSKLNVSPPRVLAPSK